MSADANEPMAEGYNRRKFLGRLAELIFAALALAAAVPLVGSAIAPALKRQRERWVDAGPAAAVEPDRPLRIDITYQSADGWLLKRVRDAAYVVSHDGKSFTVLSNICTHLACRVRWEEARGTFYCPCHDAAFDMDGEVTSGPPPRPLDRIAHKIENGRIFIKVG